MVCAIGALYLNRTGRHPVSAIDYYVAAMQFEERALECKGIELAQNILLVIIFTNQYSMGGMLVIENGLVVCWFSEILE